MKILTLFTPLLTQLARARPRVQLAITLNVVVLGLLSVWSGVAQAAPADAARSVPVAKAQSAIEVLATPASPAARTELFQRAVADDLAGRHASARSAYDALKDSEMATQIAIPSAINLVALGQFSAARQAFDAVTASGNAHEQDYAHLWQLWLTARTYNGQPQELKKELARMASAMNVSSPNLRELVRLYAGQSSVEATFAVVATLPASDELQRRDALTEVIFFSGSYLQFVAHNEPAAQELYKRTKNQLNSTSLERPLINLPAAPSRTAATTSHP